MKKPEPVKKRVLITKLCSLGDLIHTLPALSDAATAIPEIEFDWVVDKNFSEIPRLHPNVSHLILTNHRFWRANPLCKQTRKELFQALKELQKKPYDLIIDAQGNLKSALLSLGAQGVIAGWDRRSVPEWGSHLFYQSSYFVEKDLHAIERLRKLFALSLDYPYPQTPPQHQIDLSQLKIPSSLEVPPPQTYVLFVPIASYETKLWPESHWRELIQLVVKKGLSILLPWGNQQELERAHRLAFLPGVTVLPRLSLCAIGALILQAKALVCVDTGLSHLAAALNTPSVTLYGPTNPHITGTMGEKQVWIRSTSPCAKHCKRSCFHDQPCLSHIAPSAVLEKLEELLHSPA